MPSVYGPRDLVYVTPYTGSQIKYGFHTNADAGTKADLGHTDVSGAYPPGLVLGANSPKPPRATRVSSSGVSESSYCSAANVATARSAGWTVRAGRYRSGSQSARSKCLKVSNGTIEQAWRIPNEVWALIEPDAAALGLELAQSSDDDLVFGARYPKLPRVGKRVASGSGTSKVSTFCQPSRLDSLPAGWSTVRASRDRF